MNVNWFNDEEVEAKVHPEEVEAEVHSEEVELPSTLRRWRLRSTLRRWRSREAVLSDDWRRGGLFVDPKPRRIGLSQQKQG